MQFVTGYPQSQQQYNDARTAIQTHAARHRWRERRLADRGLQRREHSPDDNTSTGFSRHSSQESRRRLNDKLFPSEAIERYHAHGQPLVVFCQSLDALTLSPFLPVEHTGLMERSEIWVCLQNINVLLLRYFPAEEHGTDQLAHVLMRWTVGTEAEFQSHMCSEFVRYSCSNKSAQIWRIAVEWYTLAVRSINENLRDPNKALSDSTIHAVWALSLHGLQKDCSTTIDNKRRPAQGPLNALHLLELTGGPLKPSKIHREAWLKMLKLRGGLRCLTSSEYAHLMSENEIVTASRLLCRPSLEYISCLKLDLPESLSTNRRLDHPLKRMGFGFSALTKLTTSRFCEEVRAGLDGLALYSLAVDDYMTGGSARKSSGVLAQERNFVQHRFMCLFPGESEPEMDIADEERILLVCRSAGMIYSCLCVLPLTAAPFLTLVRHIRSAFTACEFKREWNEAPELMIWILVMVSVAGIGMPERSWSVATLDRCLRHLKIDSWDALQLLLLDFLWLPITNELDGMGLWDEVTASNPLSSV